MKLLFKYIFSLLTIVVLLSTTLSAQDSTQVIEKERVALQTDSVAPNTIGIPQDSLKTAPKASSDSSQLTMQGLEIGVDTGKILLFASDFEKKVQVSLGYLFKNRLAIYTEGGYGKLTPPGAIENGTYLSEGFYATTGLEYRLHLEGSGSFYPGIAYGISRFDDEVTFSIDSDLFNDFEKRFARTNMEARWIEFILGSEQSIKKSLFILGWKFKLRYLLSYPPQHPVDVYTIPGYGRTLDKLAPAVNFYIKYRLGKG